MAGAEDTEIQMSQRTGKGAMDIGMLGRRQVMPMWANDTVWLPVIVYGRLSRGGCRHPPLDGKQAEGGEGRSGLRRVVSLSNNSRRSLGTEGSLSEARTSPPHDSETPHGPVEKYTTTTLIITYFSFNKNRMGLSPLH